MGFLAPWFLAGLAVVGLPVWLHLLRRHRTTPLPFSSLMFFERRTQSSVKHRRLRYLVLFALRTALVVLLALAFANPWLTRTAGPAAGGRKLVVAAIDNSFSMRQGTRLDAAKRQAEQVLAGVRGNGRAQVMAFGAQVRMMSDATADPGALRAAVQAVEPSDDRGSYVELARALRSIARTAKIPVEAHVFSDMQASSLPANFADVNPGEGVRLTLHPVVSSRQPNFTVENVKAPSRVYDARKARVDATVAGYGTGRATRRVTLVLNGREVESHDADIPADGRAEVEFLSMDVPYGMNRGEVRIDGGDGFPADDRFFFSVERSDPRPALFVHEARDSRSLLYFRNALEAAAQSAFQLEPVTVEQAGGIAPGKFAFVVLSDTGALPATFEEALRQYVRAGGSVLVALGSASRGRIPAFDGKVEETRYFTRDGERFQSAGWMDPAYPSIHKTGRWDDVKFYAAARVDPGKARVVARMADDTPLLMEQQEGQGRVVVFASTLDNVANDFPLHASFVPFVEQTAAYLGRLEDRQANFPVGSYLELRAGQEQGSAVEVLGPDGRRALSLDEAARARNLRLARAGFYDIKRPKGRSELVAVNADRRESDLQVIPSETLALWRGGGGGAGGPGETEQAESKPVGLWWWVLLAALAVALAESVLGNRHLATAQEPAGEPAKAAGKEAA